MEYDALIQEILRRVSERVDADSLDTVADSPLQPTGARLLVLSPEHGELCHSILENKALKKHFSLTCAMECCYDVKLEDFQGIILLGLSVQVMGQLAGGCCISPFTQLAQRAILHGKPLFVPEEEVELYHFKATAPTAYYEMLKGKLDLLQSNGVTLVPLAQLEGQLLKIVAPGAVTEVTPVVSTPCEACPHIAKRVITERDMIDVICDHVTRVTIQKKSILTDLAADYAKAHRVAVERI